MPYGTPGAAATAGRLHVMLPSLMRPRLPETSTSESHVSKLPRSRGRNESVMATSSPERTPYTSKKSPSTADNDTDSPQSLRAGTPVRVRHHTVGAR